MAGRGDSHDPERFEPTRDGPLARYEHVHRYALAASALGRLRVLDVASGAGYGTGLLRSAGARVVALDLDARSARAAAPAVCGSALALPFADGSFDAAVCFEAIEHCREPGVVLDEIARVLGPDGVVLLSTPDRAIYSDRMGHRNPHHVAELSRAELAALLESRFPSVALYGQSVWAGSGIARRDDRDGDAAPGARRVKALEAPPGPDAEGAAALWTDPGEAAFPTPVFLLAACAASEEAGRRFQRRIGAESVLHDRAQRLLGHYLRSQVEAVARDAEIRGHADHATNLLALLTESERHVSGLQEHAANLQEILRERETHLAALLEHAANLERGADRAEERTRGVEAHAENLEAWLRREQGERQSLVEHAGNLEGLLREREAHLGSLVRHAANLEQLVDRRAVDTDGLATHARNLESLLKEREDHLVRLLEHAGSLEALLRERESQLGNVVEHAGNLEQLARGRTDEVEALAAHAGNLEALLRERESRLGSVFEHVANLERVGDERVARIDALEAHARNLETALGERESRASALEEHAANLERAHWEREERLKTADGERAAAATERDTLRSERDALQSQADRLRAERDRLRADRDAVREAADELRAELERIRSSRWYRLLHRGGASGTGSGR